MPSRRQLLQGLGAAGTVGLLGLLPERVGAQPPPETKRIRVLNRPSLCDAPQFVAEELLQGEGFSDIRYVKLKDFDAMEAAITTAEVDITMNWIVPMIARIDAGEPIVTLAGVHVGCVDVFASERMRTIRELKGKKIAAAAPRDGFHLFFGSIASYVGLDPARDIDWVYQPTAEWPTLLEKGKLDAFVGFPPITQELRARKIGQLVVSSAVDRPWSQYFCCIVAGNREFVRKHPVATKRALRAILKGADICALEPERAARALVDKGLTQRYDYALQTMKDVPYGKWREYDAEDTLRFFTLRLHEAGMIKSTPQKLLAQGTDWRFLKALKKELKG